MIGKGDGPYIHGNSFANGPGLPKWAQNWELLLALKTSASIWDHMP